MRDPVKTAWETLLAGSFLPFLQFTQTPAFRFGQMRFFAQVKNFHFVIIEFEREVRGRRRLAFYARSQWRCGFGGLWQWFSRLLWSRVRDFFGGRVPTQGGVPDAKEPLTSRNFEILLKL